MTSTHSKAVSFLNYDNAANLGEDVSGLERNGVATAVSQATVDGVTNAGVYDNNNDGRVDLSAYLADASATNQLAFSTWVRYSVAAGLYAVFSASDSLQGSGDFLCFIQGSDVKFQLRGGTGSGFTITAVGAAPAVDTWTHIAGTSGPSGATLWVDGVSVGTDVSTESIQDLPTADFMHFGISRDSGGYEFQLNGAMKDSYLSAVEFNQTTVDKIYAAGVIDDGVYGYDRVILAGQSNQAGRGVLVGGVDDDYTTIASKVEQWAYGAVATSAATNPLTHNETINPNTMGLWLNLCNFLVPLLAYKRKILVEPVAKGGTSFSGGNWNPGDGIYEDMITSCNSASSVSTLSSICAFSWFLGETDAANASTTYQADMNAMYADMVTRLNGFSATVPFISVKIGGPTGQPSDVAVINAALVAFSDESTSRYWVETSDLSLQDTVHFDNASLRLVGTRSAEAFNQVLGWISPAIEDQDTGSPLNSQQVRVIFRTDEDGASTLNALYTTSVAGVVTVTSNAIGFFGDPIEPTVKFGTQNLTFENQTVADLG